MPSLDFGRLFGFEDVDRILEDPDAISTGTPSGVALTNNYLFSYIWVQFTDIEDEGLRV